MPTAEVTDTEEAKHYCGDDMLGNHVYVGDTVVAASAGALQVYYVDECEKAAYSFIPIVRLGAPVRIGTTTSQAWHRAGKKPTRFREMTVALKVDLGQIRVHL